MADHDEMILRLADREPVASLEELAARCPYPVLALEFAPRGLGGPHVSACEEHGMLTYQVLYGESGVGSPLLRMFGWLATRCTPVR